MKKLFLFIGIIAMLSSCQTRQFCQFYTVESTDTNKKKDNRFTYENEDCLIIYDFWKNGGNPGYVFYNKTDSIIYLNLKESFFINNGTAYDYFLNREWTQESKQSKATISKALLGVSYITSKNISISESNSQAILSGEGVSFKEKPIIAIPPKSFRFISEYNINNNIITSCDKNVMAPKPSFSFTYTEKDAPIKFGNYITYAIKGNSKNVTNSFWVSEILNCLYKEVTYKDNKNECGKEVDPVIKFKPSFKGYNKFYNLYTVKVSEIMEANKSDNTY